ncbi:Hypothetical predicted protein [Lecanosticta acicola]|uniref:Uncharacterized protein n=1 Tax=Lecanosticta acicola TaxID=111012 RepID=A0AAI8Z0X1_9PEZI|nr:Hypothetical predicted protein [Lecanosticta acicola]
MSGTEETYHLTKEDIRKTEQQTSKLHGGNIPADSEAAGLQSITDTADKNKPEIINERQANLPLPDQPPGQSDFSSADSRTVNVGSGGNASNFSYGNDALREPATGDSAVRADPSVTGGNVLGQGVGREAVDGLGGLPNDAVAQGSKNKENLADTTGKDYGYPDNDPADTSKLP